MLWKCCTHYASKFGKLRSGHRTEKCVFIPIPKNGNVTECSSYHRIVLISHYSEVMLKILQARLYQSVNQDLPDVHVWFRKGRRIRDQTINIHGIIQKAREFQGGKNLLLLQFSSVSCWVVSDSLQPHESQHARPPCPSPTPGVYSNSCPDYQKSKPLTLWITTNCGKFLKRWE